MNTPRQYLAEQYKELLAEVYAGAVAATVTQALPPELQVQSWWAEGLVSTDGGTLRHGKVRILDRGRWNRCPGPDFTHAEIELNGTRIRGDIEIDPCAQAWEQHGHGANPSFNQVALHVVLSPPPPGWYTRNSLHQDIPILYIPPENWNTSETCGRQADDTLPRCRQPLAEMPAEKIRNLLQAAAAYRVEGKRKRFRARAEAVGERQAWYEAWAATLGYSANKEAMHMLALRAPLKELPARQAESILLGTAGFLLPVLPERADDSARRYHRSVWDNWWLTRERFELSPERALPWCKAPSRPLNHPQRRVAALAASVAIWSRILPLLNASGAADLSKLLSSISHPFWDTHFTLASAPMKQRAALIGQSRITDFLINHVYPYDEAEHAWQSYLAVKQASMPGSTERTAQLLFGSREDLKSTLHLAYAQQALLQIDADFCACNICLDCAFPVQLCQWAH